MRCPTGSWEQGNAAQSAECSADIYSYLACRISCVSCTQSEGAEEAKRQTPKNYLSEHVGGTDWRFNAASLDPRLATGQGRQGRGKAVRGGASQGKVRAATSELHIQGEGKGGGHHTRIL